MSVRVEHADMLEAIPRLVAEGAVCDACCTDPPYHLVAASERSNYRMKPGPHQRTIGGFMGQQWDGGDIAFRPETWATVATIMRPGAFLCAFGGTRTFHRLTCAIEDGGFVIQDCLMWLFATGFPKRRDMLKPAYEPIVLAYKPGGKRSMQIDECRIGAEITTTIRSGNSGAQGIYGRDDRIFERENPAGRWPANICHDGSDEVLAAFAAYGESKSPPVGSMGGGSNKHAIYGDFAGVRNENGHGDSGTAARFFMSAKAGAQDRWGSLHPCLTPGEAVLTDQGLRAIEAVAPGSLVLAHDGSFREVTDQFASPCNAPIYRIGVAGTNLTTTATGNHPFLVWRPKIRGNRARDTLAVGEACWATAATIRVGDYLLSPVSNRGQHDNGKSVDWWFAAGLWLAEGSVLTNGHGSSRYPQFTLAAHETDLVKRLERAFSNVGVYPRAGAISAVVFESGVVSEFIGLCGVGAKNKRIGPAVFDECPTHRRAFLDGYLAGDGCTVRGKRRAKTASRDLAVTLSRLGESVGWRASFYEYDETGSKPKFIDGRAIKPGIYYSVYFDGETDAPDFGRLPGKERGTRFIEAGPALGCRYYSIRRVKSVECDDYRGEVWNLTVRGAHTFQTVVGASHNTVKPVELMKWLVALVTPPGGLVLDCFAGSGTTGVAALATGRDAILIEREAAYHADILERMAHYEGSGKHSLVAKNRNGGRPSIAAALAGKTSWADSPQRHCDLPLFQEAEQ